MKLPQGFGAYVANIGIKDNSQDLTLVVAESACVASGVFTQSRFAGPSVVVSRENIADNTARAVVVISKNANVATGAEGMSNAREVVKTVAAKIGCGANDVLIRIHASAINLLDSKIRDGAFKLFLPYRPPFILGHDLAGTVLRVGANVRRFKAGDAVFARPRDHRIGTFAEFIAVDQEDVAIKPASLTMAEAASIPLVALTASSASAQKFPITDGQKATASQVAQAGVPLSEISPNAPDSYTVKRGDTLWAISGLFLKTPWRWPELWGMNINDIRNPHLIFPGQVLYLDKTGGRARLTTRGPADGTIKVTPRVRSESLSASAIPTVNMAVIESFLAEPLIVDEATFAKAPRIIATQENRVLLSRGDRAYARARSAENPEAAPLAVVNGQSSSYRVFRNAGPLRDPTTNAILASEAHYVC